MKWSIKHYKLTFTMIKACQTTTFTYFQFHNVQMPTTSLIIAWSSTSYKYISGVSSTWATTTSTLNQTSTISEPWNLSTPPKQFLILLDATFCLGFFGFTNNMDCPIWNYNPPNNSPHQDQGCDYYVINISCIRVNVVYHQNIPQWKEKLKK